MRSNNRWSRTLVVALIEGVLVFVGVLLGFYFENIRERNEQIELLKRDLELLSFEVTENGEIGDFIFDGVNKEIKKLDSVLALTDNMSKGELSNLYPYEVSWYGNTEPKLYALEMMLNNGSLSLIKDDNLLKIMMFDYPYARGEMLSINSESAPYLSDTSLSYQEVLSNRRSRILNELNSYSAIKKYCILVIEIDSLIQNELRSY